MAHISERRNSNIIQVEFGAIRHGRRLEDQAFLNQELLREDDPLEDLLTEFDGVIVDERDSSLNKEKHKSLSFTKQSSVEMADIISKKIRNAKENLQKVDYYLDELNLN